MTMRPLLAAVVAGLAVPGRAVACAVCLGNAFGDRSYTWPYLGLILMPFVVAAGIVGALAWQFGWRPRHVAAWVRRVARADPSPHTHTETT